MELERFCRFCLPGDGGERFGVLKGYGGKERMLLEEVSAGPFGPFERTGSSFGLGEVRLLPPVKPGSIYCVGRNYVEHASELGNQVPLEPLVFLKPVTALIGHGDAIGLPSWAGRIDYEGELAVVIRRSCRNLSEDEALDAVLGYTCFNDVTARDLQRKDGQWTRAKGFDTFAPLGPWLLLGSSMEGLGDLVTRVNGVEVQRGRLADMVFSVGRIISHISRFATLMPGDVIATGTPAGVGPLRPGDRVEVSVEGIGCLVNYCEGC
ncbi:MAG: fumarylacetoacetate hydrolase family protein [Thermanaerothrix sp.]|nr:fumarylacetoacetate hydrolase family protein [Thermanaerothrix sp.]